FVRLQADGDYHVALSDGSQTIRVELPFPACVDAASAFGCFIAHARAAIDGRLAPGSGTLLPNVTVTVAGVGYWDVNAGESGAAPNGIELHPVLAICFGRDCRF